MPIRMGNMFASPQLIKIGGPQGNILGLCCLAFN